LDRPNATRMMELIFDCETELGKCDSHLLEKIGCDMGEWSAFAHTTAAMTGPRGMLRIEQRCYLRSMLTGEMQNQPWIKPEMTLDPVLCTKKETLRTVQKLHEQFVRTSRNEFCKQSLVLV
jgi:hypothetical protein